MILPDDVLFIIREYAKPRMKYYREYKETLQAFGLTDWPEVRKRLCSEDAYTMIVALLEYRNAFFEAEDVRAHYALAVHPFHQRFYSIELSRYLLVLEKKGIHLRSLLHKS